MSSASPLAPVHGSSFYESGERVENSAHLARVFESISGVSPFGLIAHQLRKPQCAKNIAGAVRCGQSLLRLTGAHLFAINQQGNDGEGNGISQKSAQPRLPIAYFFHGRNPYHVFAIAKT
jgi:hypothetical protein